MLHFPAGRRLNRMLAAGLAILVTLTGCHRIDNSRAAAEQRMQEFYEKLKHRDFAAALDFYAPDFFLKTSREQWGATLASVQDRLGALRDFKPARWSVETQLGVDEGTFLQLVYDVRYERFSAEETFRLQRRTEASEFQIFSHEIRSAGLRSPP